MTFIHKTSAFCTAVILGAMAATTAMAADFKQGHITITSPWSRAMPNGAKVGGGYMEISNNGDSADHLVSISSEVAPRIEIHEMRMDDNIMKMRALENGIEIPAHSSVTFKPGSYHVMFFNPHAPFKEGDSFPAELHFQKAGNVKVTFDVKSMGEKGDSKSHDANHHHEAK